MGRGFEGLLLQTPQLRDPLNRVLEHGGASSSRGARPLLSVPAPPPADLVDRRRRLCGRQLNLYPR